MERRRAVVLEVRAGRARVLDETGRFRDIVPAAPEWSEGAEVWVSEPSVAPGRWLSPRPVRWAAAGAAALIMAFALAPVISEQQANAQVLAYVSVDINPSIRLEVNRGVRVFRSMALDADGRRLLRQVPVNGRPLAVALEDLVAGAVSDGFVRVNQPGAVVIAASPARSQMKAPPPAVEQAVSTASEKVYTELRARGLSAPVLHVGAGPQAVTAARKLGLSLGKYAVFKKAAQLHLRLTPQELRRVDIIRALIAAGVAPDQLREVLGRVGVLVRRHQSTTRRLSSGTAGEHAGVRSGHGSHQQTGPGGIAPESGTGRPGARGQAAGEGRQGGNGQGTYGQGGDQGGIQGLPGHAPTDRGGNRSGADRSGGQSGRPSGGRTGRVRGGLRQTGNGRARPPIRSGQGPGAGADARSRRRSAQAGRQPAQQRGHGGTQRGRQLTQQQTQEQQAQAQQQAQARQQQDQHRSQTQGAGQVGKDRGVGQTQGTQHAPDATGRRLRSARGSGATGASVHAAGHGSKAVSGRSASGRGGQGASGRSASGRGGQGASGRSASGHGGQGASGRSASSGGGQATPGRSASGGSDQGGPGQSASGRGGQAGSGRSASGGSGHGGPGRSASGHRGRGASGRSASGGSGQGVSGRSGAAGTTGTPASGAATSNGRGHQGAMPPGSLPPWLTQWFGTWLAPSSGTSSSGATPSSGAAPSSGASSSGPASSGTSGVSG